MTPIERVGNLLAKRDDLYNIHGSMGGKARTCFALMKDAKERGYVGVSTAGSRHSPQILIVANLAKALGLKCAAHTPSGSLEGSPVAVARDEVGCDIIQHKAGYNNVIIARSREFAEKNNYLDIPFGMACGTAVSETASAVKGLLPFVGGFDRIVVPVGSGMTLAGVIAGLLTYGIDVPVLGVTVGASPVKRLDKYAPFLWRSMVSLVNAGVPYQTPVQYALGGIHLDEIYEAKCGQFLKDRDLFWIIGTRNLGIK